MNSKITEISEMMSFIGNLWVNQDPFQKPAITSWNKNINVRIHEIMANDMSTRREWRY